MLKVGDFVQLVNGMTGNILDITGNTVLVYVNGENYKININNLVEVTSWKTYRNFVRTLELTI